MRRTIWVGRERLKRAARTEAFLLSLAPVLFECERLELHRTAAVLWDALRVAVQETKVDGDVLACAFRRMRVPGMGRRALAALQRRATHPAQPSAGEEKEE